MEPGEYFDVHNLATGGFIGRVSFAALRMIWGLEKPAIDRAHYFLAKSPDEGCPIHFNNRGRYQDIRVFYAPRDWEPPMRAGSK